MWCRMCFFICVFSGIYSSEKIVACILSVLDPGMGARRFQRRHGDTERDPLFCFLSNLNLDVDGLPHINPSTTTTRVKISQNVDILPKAYLVHLKVKHCQTLRVVSTFTGQNKSTVFDW